MRICLATSGHEADDDRIFFKEARSLVRAGAEVTLAISNTPHPRLFFYGVKVRAAP